MMVGGTGLRAFAPLLITGEPERSGRWTWLEAGFEANVNNIAIAHHVVFALQPQLARLLDLGIRLEQREVFVADHFGADESACDVTMNFRGSFQRGFSAPQRPTMRLRLARGV